jgi:N-acetylated-alpha-linked acidic dipeptidase
LPITYHAGPGPAIVRLKVDFDWTSKPVCNVIATIPGRDFPDQWVLYGNHHDAWVNGANDPLSGAASLLETARTLALLAKDGWQPRRTIKLALWDAEEFGLIGSTEWVEKHRDELDRNAVAYINSDANSRGSIGVGGSHTLETFVTELLNDVTDPRSGKTLLESRRKPQSKEANGEFHLSSLGAGSDYVAFIDHLGVSSLNLGFSGEGSGGVYHSIYDSFHWYSQFGDPGFVYGKALSQVTTTALLRLADAPLLPFEFTSLGQAVSRFLDEIQKEAGSNAGKLELKEVHQEASRLLTAAKTFESEYQRAALRAADKPAAQLRSVNQTLYRAERALTLPGGLPGREWYRHQLYAPGMYTGYGVKTLPGVREAAEAGRWEEAAQQARELARVLRGATVEVVKATGQLKELAR